MSFISNRMNVMYEPKISLVVLALFLGACRTTGAGAGAGQVAPLPALTLGAETNPLNNCTPYVRPKRALLLTANVTGNADATYTVRFVPEAITAIGVGTSTGDFFAMQANLRYELRLALSNGDFEARLYQLAPDDTATLVWPTSGTKEPSQDGTYGMNEPSFDPVFLYQHTQSNVRYAHMLVAHRGKEIRLLVWNP